MQDKDKFVPWWKSSLDDEAATAAFAFKVYNLNSIKWFSLFCVAHQAFVNSMVFADHSCLNRQSEQKYLRYLDTTYGRGKKLHIHTFQFNSLQASLLSFAQKVLTFSLSFARSLSSSSTASEIGWTKDVWKNRKSERNGGYQNLSSEQSNSDRIRLKQTLFVKTHGMSPCALLLCVRVWTVNTNSKHAQHESCVKHHVLSI